MFIHFHQFPINLFGVGVNIHNLLVTFSFGQSKHLLSGHVAQAFRKQRCLEVGAAGHRVWLTPVPPPKGKFSLNDGTRAVNTYKFLGISDKIGAWIKGGSDTLGVIGGVSSKSQSKNPSMYS